MNNKQQHQQRSGYGGWRSTRLTKLKFLQARLSYALQVRTRTAADARRASEEQLKRQKKMDSVSKNHHHHHPKQRGGNDRKPSPQEVEIFAATQEDEESLSPQTQLLSYLLTQSFFKRPLADFLTPVDALKFGQTSRNAQLIKVLPSAAIFHTNSLKWYKQQQRPSTATVINNGSNTTTTNIHNNNAWQPLPLRHRSADIHAVCLTTTCRWCDRCLGGRFGSHNNIITGNDDANSTRRGGSANKNTVSVIAIMQGDNNGADIISDNNCRICQDLSPRAVLAHHPSQGESSFIFRADHEKDRVIRGYSVWARVGGGGVHFLHARRLCLRESVYAVAG